tara:strand:- start:1999 stop:2190 length:192 start_codon:yes stop_codon:yes gene_type:complete
LNAKNKGLLFAAAQAAQKVKAWFILLMSKFAAAQAAQKMKKVNATFFGQFAAAQAAQKGISTP